LGFLELRESGDLEGETVGVFEWICVCEELRAYRLDLVRDPTRSIQRKLIINFVISSPYASFPKTGCMLSCLI